MEGSKLGPFEENTIVVGDCLDVMAQMPDECVDLVFFDPPYGIGVADWDMPFPSRAVKESLRVLKKNGHLYASCTPHILPRMISLLPYRRIITWCKTNVPLRKSAKEWHWATEFILWCANDGATLDLPYGPAGKDYWLIWVESGFLNPDEFSHPARKPAMLLDRIIRSSSKPSDIVADFFMGSGTTAVVADRLGRRFFGCDISEEYVAMALERLEKDRAARQLELDLAPQKDSVKGLIYEQKGLMNEDL